jgi:hypothetical protein
MRASPSSAGPPPLRRSYVVACRLVGSVYFLGARLNRQCKFRQGALTLSGDTKMVLDAYIAALE